MTEIDTPIRERLAEALNKLDASGWDQNRTIEAQRLLRGLDLADALLAAGVFPDAAPNLTREQVAEAVAAVWLDPQARYRLVVDAVWALINKSAQ